MGVVCSGVLEVVRDGMNMRLCAIRRFHSKVWSCDLRSACVGWLDTSEEMKWYGKMSPTESMRASPVRRDEIDDYTLEFIRPKRRRRCGRFSTCSCQEWTKSAVERTFLLVPNGRCRIRRASARIRAERT